MNNNTIKRYQWEDAVIEAETQGLLPAGAVNLCLRLAKAITWEPKKGTESGLYWKNEDALKAVNSSRATYFRYRQTLFDLGFFKEVAGNLIPQVPDLSQIETTESHIETVESQIETAQSQIDTPYTVDTYTGDSSSEDVSTVENAPVVASAPTDCVSLTHPLKETLLTGSSMDLPFEVKTVDGFSYLLLDTGVTRLDAMEETPQSQIETDPFWYMDPANPDYMTVEAVDLRIAALGNREMATAAGTNDSW